MCYKGSKRAPKSLKMTNFCNLICIFVHFFVSLHPNFLSNTLFVVFTPMIIDKITNADRYFDCVPGLEQFIKFYNDNDLEDLPACKLRLDGSDLYLSISDIQGKDEQSANLEAHRDYIDIQVPLTATERMGWKPLEDCLKESKEYDEGKDVEFYADQPAFFFDVPVGYFVVFFPSDAHVPGIGKGNNWRKVVAKSRIAQ